MKSVVISQPMFFPWIGLFEQILLADVYVHYDDVQFSKGSFVNRVQIKTREKETQWLTVPLSKSSLGQDIRETRIQKDARWKERHLKFLTQTYSKARYAQDMLDLVDFVYRREFDTISELAIASMGAICEYFGIADPQDFLYASRMNAGGKSSERVLEIVRELDGDIYITGHGARNYLDHQLFERNSVRIEYMNYRLEPYEQLFGDFTPYVSILDLVANCGSEGARVIQSKSVDWKDFLRISNGHS